MTPPPSATADYDPGYQYAPEDIHGLFGRYLCVSSGR